MGQEGDCLAQILAGQQHLAAKYQELDTFVKQHVHSWQERDNQWTHKLDQDADWRVGIDEKIQAILDLVPLSMPTSGPPPTFALPNFGQPPLPNFSQPPNFGQPPPPNFGQTPNFGQPPSTFHQSPFQVGQAAPFQTVAGESLGSYSGWYLQPSCGILLMICRSRRRKVGVFFKEGVLIGSTTDSILTIWILRLLSYKSR
jgi:hypothetical protein